jgi:tetratricopeptide (TPR) repeat protein
MSDKENGGTAALKKFDIDSAIAAFTTKIDTDKEKNKATPGAATDSDKKILSAADAYRSRGIARCFNPPQKDGIYADAISDLSAAMSLNSKDTAIDTKALYYYRAYAYYRSKLYDRAIADCETALEPENSPKPGTAPFHELRGLIYAAMKRWPEAAENYRKAITILLGQSHIVTPSLSDNYRAACERMRDD